MLLPAFVLFIIGSLMIPSVHGAISTSHLASDAEMNLGTKLIMFIAQGRRGDLAGAATYEVNLEGPSLVTAQYAWPNGASVPFTLTYDRGTNLVTFTVGSGAGAVTVSLNLPDPLLPVTTEIFVRTRAVPATQYQPGSMLVDSLVLKGIGLSDQSHATAPGSGLDILWISCDYGYLSGGFTLTGQATMRWTGTPSNLQSQIAFQIKIVDPPVEKEPPQFPVGGYVEPLSKLSIIAPYVALLGLVVPVAVVVAKPWKRD